MGDNLVLGAVLKKGVDDVVRQCGSVGGVQGAHQQRGLGRIAAQKVLVGIDMSIVGELLRYSVTFSVSDIVHNLFLLKRPGCRHPPESRLTE